MTRILAFSGSARQDSFNQRLVAIAAEAARDAGADLTLINLADYPLPIFNEDLEAESGTPDAARQLVKLFVEHDGLLIACPEYNSSITPLLKNTIDWVSRKTGDHPPLAAYRNKVATLMSASPGGLGGLRGLVHVRSILSSIGVIVLPRQIAVRRAFEAFAEDGRLLDEKQHAEVQRLGSGLSETLSKLAG